MYIAHLPKVQFLLFVLYERQIHFWLQVAIDKSVIPYCIHKLDES